MEDVLSLLFIKLKSHDHQLADIRRINTMSNVWAVANWDETAVRIFDMMYDDHEDEEHKEGDQPKQNIGPILNIVAADQE